jgi:hypothetical protein
MGRDNVTRNGRTSFVSGLISLMILGMCLCVFARENPKDKQPPWIAKDWTQWTSDECYQVLNDSPWALKKLDYLPSAGPGRAFTMTIVQLRSALPIRQALLRSLRLEKHFDKLNVQKQQEFDQQHTPDLTDGAASNVLLVIYHSSTEPPPEGGNNVPGRPSTLFGPDLARQAALLLPDVTTMLPSETRKVNYKSTGIDQYMNQFEYVFPRTTGGKPIYLPSDSFLTISLGAPLVVDKKTGKAEAQAFQSSGMGFSFKIADLMYKGKLEY